MSIAAAILNQKGGSGKTPLTIDLAGALTALGKSVLVFDLDGQADLTTGVGFNDKIFADSSENIFSLLTGSRGSLRKVIRPAPNDHNTARKAGIGRVAPHDLRRTHITEGLNTGATVADMQAQAGHVNAATTLRYAQAHEAQERRRRISFPAV